jgi:hypothetical protein
VSKKQSPGVETRTDAQAIAFFVVSFDTCHRFS